MTTRPAPATRKPKEVVPAGRTPPVATQHLAELAWNIFEDAGEDVLVPKETITSRIHATESQFTRLKGYVRDNITMRRARRSCPSAADT